MVNFDPSKNNFASAASSANEVWKALKKDEKKGVKASKIQKAIQDFHLAHEKVKEELAEALSQEIGKEVKPDSDMVENAVFSLSLGKIFENRDGQESLSPDLKNALQHFDSESQQAKEVIANTLSKGSKGKVPSNDKLIGMDLDEISIRTIDNPDLIG